MPSDTPFFGKLKSIEATLASGQDPRSALQAIKPILSDPDIYREFFSMLTSPDWINPLFDAGYFANVPAAMIEKGGIRRYSSWPSAASSPR